MHLVVGEQMVLQTPTHWQRFPTNVSPGRQLVQAVAEVEQVTQARSQGEQVVAEAK